MTIVSWKYRVNYAAVTCKNWKWFHAVQHWKLEDLEIWIWNLSAINGSWDEERHYIRDVWNSRVRKQNIILLIENKFQISYDYLNVKIIYVEYKFEIRFQTFVWSRVTGAIVLQLMNYFVKIVTVAFVLQLFLGVGVKHTL